MMESSLHEAVRFGNTALVNEILQRDSSCVNDWNFEFETPLHLVYDNMNTYNSVQADDRLPIMTLLIEYGANLNLRGVYNTLQTPLHVAVRKQQINGVKLLLENKADPNIRDIYHKTALHYATQEKSRKIVEMLLIHKADPNIIDMNYRLPLDIAISLYKVGSAKKLITFGRTKNSFTQVSIAKSSDIFRSLLSICQLNINRWTLKHKHFIRYILRRADELYVHGEFSLKALMYYAEWDKHERFHQNQEKKTCILFEVLHKIGVSIDDSMGELDLHRASRHQNEEMVKALIRKGANVNVKNFYGETPLHLSLKAMESSYRENDGQKDYRIASLLIENGANIHEHDYIKETPFSLAVKIKCWPSLNLMLAKANVDLVTYENPVATESDDVSIRFCENNPKLHELIVAVAMGHENVVNQLLDKNFIDDTSKHPCQDLNAMMYVAIEKRQVNLVKILLEAGFRTDGHFSVQMPRFNIRNFNDNDIMMACLLWEFKDYETINLMIIYNFFEGSDRLRAEIFSSLIIFYYAIYLQLNKVHHDLVPINGLFTLDGTWSRILCACTGTINELKKVKIGHKSIFDIMTIPLDSYVELLDYENYHYLSTVVLLALQENTDKRFYEYVLQTRIQLAMEKRNVLTAAKNVLNEAFESVIMTTNYMSLPDEIIWNILSYLNMRELKKIGTIN